MRSNADSAKVRTKRSRSKSRHGNGKRNKKARSLSARPAAASNAVDGNGAQHFPIAICPACYNTGMFSAPQTLDGPTLLHYCECDRGTERLAIVLNLLKITRR
jgi:hypothetical protein